MSIKKVAYEFDPFKKTGVDVPKNKRAEALEAVANFVKEEVLSAVGDGSSPVKGGAWKRSLSKSYKKVKGSQSSSSIANLELSGDMLDALDVVKLKGDKLSLQVAGSEAPKADGNNRGTYGKSERTNLSLAREFIPRSGKTFTQIIWDGIEQILEGFKDEG